MVALDLDVDYIIKSYIIDKKSTKKIAKELKCSYTTINKRLKNSGIKIRSISESRMGLMMGEKNLSFKKLDDENIIKEYTINNRSAKSIAKELKCDPKTIIRHLKNIGIKTRGHSEALMGIRIGDKNPRFKNLDTDYIKKAYVIDEKSASIIAAELGCAVSTIFNKLHQQGTKSRTISETKKGKNNPFYKKYGQKNPNWRGGLSFGKYCWKFNDSFKEEVRKNFNRVCYICSETEKENKRHLDVHHIDFNKNSICNGKKWAFLPLCQKCHSKTSTHRHFYFNLLINYWFFNPEINFQTPFSFF